MDTRTDPSIAEGIETSLTFHMPVLGVVVDAVGSTAVYRAREAADAVLGAIWLLTEEPTGWMTWPPTLLGDPTVAESPRSPDYEAPPGDGLVPLSILRVDSRGDSDPARIEWRPSNLNVGEVVASDDGSILERVADAHRDADAGMVTRRLAAACRFLVQSARSNDPGTALLQATVALAREPRQRTRERVGC